MKLAPERRRLLLGLAHRAAAQLGMDEDTRRAAQMAYAGKASLRDFTDGQLIGWCWELKRRGADIGIPGPPPKGGVGWERPTAAQWAEIERLMAQLGLTEAGLTGFVRRTCGVDDPRFLTRRGATEVISGLRRWQAQRQRHAGQRAVDRAGRMA